MAKKIIQESMDSWKPENCQTEIYTYIMLAQMASKMAAGIYKNVIDKAAGACERFQGDQKRQCMLQYKINATAAQIKKIESMKSRCGNSDDPAKCITSLVKKINKLKNKYDDLKASSEN